ncbi:hypothetical protein [Burkholderia phage vB_BglM_WTB]
MKSSIDNAVRGIAFHDLEVGALFVWRGYVFAKCGSTALCVATDQAEANCHHRYQIGDAPEFADGAPVAEVVNAAFYVTR